MVADKNHDPISKLYAEWVSASVRLSVAGFDAAAKIMEAGMQSVVAARARSNATPRKEEAIQQTTSAPKSKPAAPKVVPVPTMAQSAPDAGNLSPKTDDLKLISGIGPKLEQMLQKRGIASFAQVAALSATDMANLDEELGLNGRIQSDDWKGQAAKLAG